jgi:hypothetical protein
MSCFLPSRHRKKKLPDGYGGHMHRTPTDVMKEAMSDQTSLLLFNKYYLWGWSHSDFGGWRTDAEYRAQDVHLPKRSPYNGEEVVPHRKKHK